MIGGPVSLPRHSTDELLFWLPRALSRPETTDWERGFIKSVLGRSKRPGWAPSPGQERTMRRIVEAMFSAPEDDLIDDEGA